MEIYTSCTRCRVNIFDKNIVVMGVGTYLLILAVNNSKEMFFNLFNIVPVITVF